MTNEELLTMGTMMLELHKIRVENEGLKKDFSENEKKALDLDVKERKIAYFVSELERTKNERDKARRELDAVMKKFGSLCRVVNLLNDCDKSKQPRVFLREFVSAIRDCIEKNDIHMTEGGMAR